MQDYNIKSFGTILRDHPDVEKMAEQLYTFAIKDEKVRELPKEYTSRVVPNQFRGDEVWQDFIFLPQYLGDCGNGWADSVVNVIADRFNIYSINQIYSILSSTEILYCNTLKKPPQLPNIKSQTALNPENPCTGFSVYDALEYIFQHGISESTCFSQSELIDHDYKTLDDFSSYTKFKDRYPDCKAILGPEYQSCVDRKRARRIFKIRGAINVARDEGFRSIKYQIYRFGPVIGSFLLYDDFLKPYNGTTIYTGPSKSSQPLAGHSIEILGWGVDSKTGIEFWVCSNNWSTKWGNNGYFKIKVGIPECMLEDNIVAPLIDIPTFDWDKFPEYLKIPQSWQTTTSPKTDPDNFYALDTIPLIRESRLIGDLAPLIQDKSAIPRTDIFWACDIDIYLEQQAVRSEIDAQYIVSKTYYVRYTVIILLAILTGWLISRLI